MFAALGLVIRVWLENCANFFGAMSWNFDHTRRFLMWAERVQLALGVRMPQAV